MPREAAPVVLVLDDLSEIVEELIEMLDLADIPASGAGTLDEAIARLALAPNIRIVICDVRLSRECGLDIVARVQAAPTLAGRAFQYIFITGDPQRIEQAGASFDGLVLEKPVQPRALIQHIESLLRHGGASQ